MRPLTITTPEVQAALAGAVQVRRCVKAPFAIDEHPDTGVLWPLIPGYCNDGDNEGEPIDCPFGVPGDKAWVREKYGVATYCGEFVAHSLRGVEQDASECLYRIVYAAEWGPNQEGCIWRSPVTMPRWASRLALELIAVRVERDGFGWVWVGDWIRMRETSTRRIDR